jgi:hypothetical protein
VKIFVKVKPNSKTEGVKKIDPERGREGSQRASASYGVDPTHFEVRVKTPPIEGKANAAAISALTRHLGIPRSRIKILAGAKSKQKVFEISR